MKARKELTYFGLYLIAGINSGLSKGHSGPMEDFIHGYAHDITLPAGFYFFSRMLGWKTSSAAPWAFLGCSAFEIAQKFNLYPGTFDSKDFLAYAIGTGAALGLDKIVLNRKKKANLEALTLNHGTLK